MTLRCGALGAALLAAFAAASPERAPAATTPPASLPGASASTAGQWILAVRDTDAARSLGRRAGARWHPSLGVLVVNRGKAGRLGAALRRRGLLRWAEPDRLRDRLPMPSSTADAHASTLGSWRDRMGLAGLVLPAVGPATRALAIVDTPVDLTHPAFAGGHLSAKRSIAPYDLHGTATAAVAGSTGGVQPGVWPGMRITSYPLSEFGATCSGSALAITQAVHDGAAAINMSYGSTEPCFTELAAIQEAVRAGVIPVAAAGNDLAEGNLPSYPAWYPHVLTAEALGPVDAPAYFSSASDAADIAAPGQDVLTAVPIGFDADGTADGWTRLTGTSFSAPMVAAAATWLRAVRPEISGAQIAAMLCAGARDVGRPGWDRRSGCGALDVAAAMRRPVPPPDPAEPNDDVTWVEDVVLRRAAAPIWRSGRRVLRASVTRLEDPVDVYRVIRPTQSRLRVTLVPRLGGADLRILDASALEIDARDAVLGTSRRPGTGPDRVTVPPAGRGSRVAYVVVTHDSRSGPRQTRYQLQLRRGSSVQVTGEPQ
jgi:Subtilase family